MTTDMGSLWDRTLAIMEEELPKPSFETWLKHTRVVEYSGDNIVIAVPNEFARDWVQKKYADRIAHTVRLLTGKPLTVSFTIHADAAREQVASAGETSAVEVPLLSPNCLSPLNPKYTFETFVIGNGNRFAHAAALAVAESPARSYNPLFIYGGVGLGKTHLMQAIGHYVLRHYPNLKVLYVSSETFTNELINSIRDQTTVEFRNRYRNIDVLLIDDIQFLAGKESTQEEFFHTFNALHAANKQVVVSSDRPPKEIPTLEERLRSRFEGGLISDIQPPDLETRVAILRKKAELESLDIPEDVILFIATKINTNIRELEGALIRLLAYSTLTRAPIDLNMAKEALRDVLPTTRPKEISVELIQQVVARHYNLKTADLKVRKRTRAVAFPRQVAMYLAREMTTLSLPRIGEKFGGRDHTTVLHACEKIASQAQQDPDLHATLDELREKIRAS